MSLGRLIWTLTSTFELKGSGSFADNCEKRLLRGFANSGMVASIGSPTPFLLRICLYDYLERQGVYSTMICKTDWPSSLTAPRRKQWQRVARYFY